MRRPRVRYCRCILIRSGISARQGAHHVAQKLMSTTSPLKASRLKERPLMSVKVKLGARFDCAVASPGVIKISSVRMTRFITELEQILHTNEDISVCPERQWSCIEENGKLKTSFDHEA